MRTRPRTSSIAFAVSAALIAAVALVRLWPAADPTGPYVALGDSYTAAPQVPDQNGTPPGCERSDRNYPSLVARTLKLDAADFQDVSCSSATLADLTAPQQTKNGTNPAQLSVLSTATRLITLGIGGNDIGFSSIIKQCIVLGVASFVTDTMMDSPTDGPCRDWYSTGGVDRVEQQIRKAGDQLTQVLSEIHERSPKAKVLLVGYPAILPSTNTACNQEIPVAAGDMAFLREKEEQLNTMLREDAGDTYVDTYTPSAGHDACTAAGTRWIEPVQPAAGAAAIHPNERGERGMADAVLQALGVAA